MITNYECYLEGPQQEIYDIDEDLNNSKKKIKDYKNAYDKLKIQFQSLLDDVYCSEVEQRPDSNKAKEKFLDFISEVSQGRFDYEPLSDKPKELQVLEESLIILGYK